MKILYGDATESPLQQDYLALLSAVVDFGVAVLSGLGEIVDLETDAARLEDDAVMAREQLAAVEDDLTGALTITAERTTAPIARVCVDELVTQGKAQIERSQKQVEAELQATLGRLKQQIAAIRRRQLEHAGALVMSQRWPGTTEWVDLTLSAGGSYRAELIGQAPLRLSWVIALDIPDNHPLAEPLRVEDVVGPLHIDAPAEGGWMRKSVKRRDTKLGKTIIAGYSRDGGVSCLALRDAPGAATGYDLLFDAEGRPTAGHLVVDGERSEGFELADGDETSVAELGRQLGALARRLIPHRRQMVQVQLDGEPFEAHPDPAALLQRMVEHLTPVIADIEARSPLPGELVLKRAVEGSRREELFLSKADLSERLAPLPPPAAALFAPLGIAPVEPEMETSVQDEQDLATLEGDEAAHEEMVEIEGDAEEADAVVNDG